MDFQFLAPGEDGRGETPEDLWLSMSVFFLAASGRGLAVNNGIAIAFWGMELWDT